MLTRLTSTCIAVEAIDAKEDVNTVFHDYLTANEIAPMNGLSVPRKGVHVPCLLDNDGSVA